MAFLEIEQISKAYGAKQVLDELSLSVEAGECMVVFGQSGCGKTTLLRALAGMVEPACGAIRMNGEDITRFSPDRRNIAMAFQNFALYPHMSAFENIASPLRASKIAPGEITRRVVEIAELLRIDHVLAHLPRELSNGQKQRTTLARSLIRRPPLILLDDPLRNVDAKIRNEMRFELPRLLRSFNATVLYVTQDYREALALGDRIGVMVGGRFAQIGDPRSVYRAPKSERIARLFGDPPINLFNVSPMHTKDGGVCVAIGGTQIALPPEVRLPAANLTLGIRPEHVGLSFDPASQGLPVSVEAVTPFNVRTVALLKMHDGTEILASQPENDALLATREHRAGFARLDLKHALFFDGASGARL